MLAVTLLVPVLFLMAVVVFYGCLLIVLANRMRPQSVASRPELAATMIEAPPRLASAISSRPAQDRTPVRFLIVVSRQDPARYHELRRIFGRHGNTDVIFDRRGPEPRAGGIPGPATPRHAERRQRHVDEDLRVTGWAMLRLTG